MSNILNALTKVFELISLLEKDYSGVRVRSPTVLFKDELLEQVQEVIKRIKDDIDIVERGISALKTWFTLRKQALSGITNLNHSIKKSIDESKSVDEIKDSLRMFSLAAAEDFIHNLVRLENLWKKDVLDVTRAMNRVLSIMIVTQEKIERYKTQLNINEKDLSNSIEELIKALLENDLSHFNELESILREKLIHGE